MLLRSAQKRYPNSFVRRYHTTICAHKKRKQGTNCNVATKSVKGLGKRIDVGEIAREQQTMSELVAAAEVTIDEINARGAEVSKLVSSKAFIPALLKALEKPPLMTKDAKIKEANRDIVFKVIENITTDAQISKTRCKCLLVVSFPSNAPSPLSALCAEPPQHHFPLANTHAFFLLCSQPRPWRRWRPRRRLR